LVLNVTALTNSSGIANTLSYIEANGLMVSNTWRIGQETANGNSLIFRDVVLAAQGINSGYLFAAGVSVNV